MAVIEKEMFVYDTNEIIKEIRQKQDKINDGFCLIDFNIFELFKNKTDEERKGEFNKINTLLTSKNGKYLLRNCLNKNEKLLNNPNTPTAYKIKILNKIAMLISEELTSFCISICFIIMTIVAFSKSNVDISNGEVFVRNDVDYEATLINRALMEEIKYLEGSAMKKIAKELYAKQKDDVDLWFVQLYNTIASYFNERLQNSSIPVLKSKHINLNDLTDNCSIKISETKIDEFVDALVSPKENEKETRYLFKKIIKSIFIDNKAFEFNHLCDLYMQFAAERLGAVFISTDNKRIIW